MRVNVISFIVVICAALTGVAWAQVPVTAQNTRLLHTFDFEERQLGNDEDLPMYWEKITGTDFPHYNNGWLTTDRHRSGGHSFRMDLDGGSCAYRYPPGHIRVQQGNRYRFEGYCQTSNLLHARARLTAYLTDADQHPLPATVRHSELYASNATDQDWHLLSVEVADDSIEAVFLVVQIELLQPNQYAVPTLGHRSLFLQDVHGSAWFDDMDVAQVPQITLTTGQTGNIFHRSDPGILKVQVDEQSADDLTVQLVITDAANRRIYQHTSGQIISDSRIVGPGVRELSLPLPIVAPGWYRATLAMISHGVYVGHQTLDWLRLADDDTGIPSDPRFGAIATDFPSDNWPDLQEILPIFSFGRLKLAMWSKTSDVQQMDPNALGQIFDNLKTRGVQTTGCLVALPPRLEEILGGHSWLQLLTAREDDWQTPLSFLISRHANQLDHWQLGADGIDDFAVNPDMRKVYSRVLSKYAALIEKPDLAMPYPVWYEAPMPPPSSLALSVPDSILPAEIPLYLQEFKGKEAANVSLSLSPIDRDTYGRPAQIRDIAQRIIFSLAGGASRIDLPLPMVIHHQGERMTAEPSELAIIEHTLLKHLSGTTFRGQVPLADDIEGFLFERAGQGILVVWDKNDVTEAQPLAVNLGSNPVQIDLWGNASPLLRATSIDGSPAPAGLAMLKIGRIPTILTGVDSPMCQLRASVSVDQPLIESSLQAHVRHIRFVNPYPMPIGGTIKLRAPLGWSINPPILSFTLNPNETFDRDVAIEIPYNTIAGKVNIRADFDLQAEEHTKFTVPIPLSVGLSDVGTQCMAYRDRHDVMVQQIISNYGDKPVSYAAFALYPGRPRIERLVTTLLPGRTIIKKYRFTDVPKGQSVKIRVGLKESEGTRVLNDEVEIK